MSIICLVLVLARFPLYIYTYIRDILFTRYPSLMYNAISENFLPQLVKTSGIIRGGYFFIKNRYGLILILDTARYQSGFELHCDLKIELKPSNDTIVPGLFKPPTLPAAFQPSSLGKKFLFSTLTLSCFLLFFLLWSKIYHSNLSLSDISVLFYLMTPSISTLAGKNEPVSQMVNWKIE